MIVTCERCATRFQLDDERVPEDGVRVRCSRCKHAFFIERPARSEAETVHRIARRALDETPATTRDLDDAAGEPAPDDELDEDDWQFVDDVPFVGGNEEEDDGDADGVSPAFAANVVDDLLGATSDETASDDPFDAGGLTDHSAAGDDDEGLSLAFDDNDADPFDAPGSVGEFDDDSPELEDEGAPLSLVDDGEPATRSGDYQDESVAEVGAADPGDSGLGLEGPGPIDETAGLLADLREELEQELAPEPTVAPEAQRQREVVTQPTHAVETKTEQDELGDLDEWDLADAAESPMIASGLTLPTRTLARVPSEFEDDLTPRAQWLVRAGNVVGWASVVLLFLVGLHGGVVTQAAVPLAASARVDVGGFGVSDVNTHWIDNLYAGPMLVVSGSLTNEAAPAGAGLGLVLLDSDGEALDEVVVMLGPALGESSLRGHHPDGFAAEQRALVAEGWPSRAGQERRFHVVSQGVPEAATGVRFEALPNAMPLSASEVVSEELPAESASFAPVASAQEALQD